MLHRKLFYVQVHPGHFLVRIHGETKSVKRECSGLDHPRSLAGDFFQLQQCLTELFRELQTPLMRLIKPDALVHLRPQVEGGYTNIELRAFKELATGAGARSVFLCTDRHGPLSDSQIVEFLNTVR